MSKMNYEKLRSGNSGSLSGVPVFNPRRKQAKRARQQDDTPRNTWTQVNGEWAVRGRGLYPGAQVEVWTNSTRCFKTVTIERVLGAPTDDENIGWVKT